MTTDPCHECSCHRSPPCSRCVECVHYYVSDCPEDCQTCSVDHESEAS